jgi:FkbM family methyltransferase
MKATFLDTMRRIVRWLPRSKMLQFIAQQYTFHYYNLYDANFERNGELRWLREALINVSEPVVFDVGANTGEWTNAVLQVNPTSHIHAFEPMPEVYQVLAKRFADDRRVTTTMKGLGSTPTEVVMHIFNNASEHNSIHGRPDRLADRISKVQLTTLDDYCLEHHIEHIHFLKVDTEGHEVAVLQGGVQLLKRQAIDVIQFEYASNYILARSYLKDVFELLTPFGYRIYRIMPHKLQPVPNYHEHFENFMYCNYAAIKS